MRTIPPILAALWASTLCMTLNAQVVEGCATSATPEVLEHLDKHAAERAAFNGSLRNGPVLLPLNVTIIRYSDGWGGIKTNDLYEQLHLLNERLSPGNIEFFLCGPPEFVDDDYLASFDPSKEEALLNYEVGGAINLFLVPKLKGNDGKAYCGWAYFPGALKDRVLIQSGCALNGSTLIHEIGHYLSLYHTHSTSQGPGTVNGQSCNVNGDRVCDTPADPNLLGLVNDDCEYTGNVTDPNGDKYKPQTTNIMSYALPSCRTTFTQEQYNRMLFSAIHDRGYLGCTDTFHFEYTPELGELPLRVFPNPTASVAQVSVENLAEGDFYAVSVFNLRGETVFTTRKPVEARISAVNVDLSGFEKGIYMVALTNGITTQTAKLIHQ